MDDHISPSQGSPHSSPTDFNIQSDQRSVLSYLSWVPKLVLETGRNGNGETSIAQKQLVLKEGIPEGKQKKTLNKVEEYFFVLLKKMFPSYKAEFESRVQKQASEVIQISSLQKKLHLKSETYKINESKPGGIPKISEELLLDPNESVKKKYTDHRELAENAVQNETHKNISPIKTPIGEMIGYSYENRSNNEKLDPILNQTVPTSYTLGHSKGVENHLTNIYVIKVDGKDYAIIRSGKIDSQEAVEEFSATLRQIHRDLSERFPEKNIKLRVVSQQLNSFERENKIINAQHRWIAFANHQLDEEGIAEIIHINLPSNRFYQFTRVVQSLGLLGKFISKYIYFKGERLSKEQNLDSWGTYVKWVGEDINSVTEKLKRFFPDKYSGEFEESITRLVDPSNLQVKKEIRSEIDALVGSIEDEKMMLKTKSSPRTKEQKIKSKENISDLKKQLREKRIELKRILLQDYQHLEKLEEQLKPLNEGATTKTDFAPLYQKISLLRQVLGTQLDKESMERGKEGLSIQLLNIALGITTAINCKSGLDRTSFWHAVRVALDTFVNTFGLKRSFSLVNEWSVNSTNLNKLYVHFGPREVEAWLMGGEELENVVEYLGIDASELESLRKKMADIAEYRNIILNNLIKQGLPITFASTGAIGIKWNKGLQENLIPLNFIPPFIEINGTCIQIVKFNERTGEPTGITAGGRQLLTKFQSLRGA